MDCRWSGVEDFNKEINEVVDTNCAVDKQTE